MNFFLPLFLLKNTVVLTFDIRCLTSGNEKKMHIPNCNMQGSEANIFFSYIDYIKKLSPRIQMIYVLFYH